ncbi:MAG: hypothetical protein AMJ81_08485 [Phycisphaerae bacterium SM23_33]|nr:MAG: hypothetical protein AMJ81_08485 [Phycisphaerae bacterium SM23_33]
MAKLKHKIHLISLTHWDREWRFPFEETRMLLVEMMDGLLDLLDREPAYRHYHLDGQSILLEDYLEARPENRARLTSYIRDGRILIGPWYTLPATSMVDGESLIRNFLVGAKVCAEFGRRMDVGYTPAGYGQPSQMPQILRNFGIDSAMFYRGISRKACPNAEYWWDGPDGSRVLGFRLGDYARANFFYFVYRPVVHNRDNSGMAHHWEDGGLPVRLCDGRSTTCYYVLEAASGFHPENVAPSLTRIDSEEIRGTTTPYGLAMQCDDSVEPHEAEARIIEHANRELGEESIVHSSLPEYAHRVRRHIEEHDVQLDVLTGEMRHTLQEGVWTDLLPDVLGNRPDIRQGHRRSEVILTGWAEPWATIAWMLGREYPDFYLERCWKLLLANEAHDSLNGGSMDWINHETAVRNEKIQTIAGGVRRRSLEEIVRRIDTSGAGERDVFLVVFNPAAADRDEVVTATVDFPVEWNVSSYRLTDMSGAEVAFQEVSAVEDKATFQRPSELPLRLPVVRHAIYLQGDRLPAMGYRVYRVEAGTGYQHRFGSMLTAPAAIENEHLRLAANRDGTIDLLHKPTGRLFRQLNHFDDISEIGDPWTGRHSQKEKLVLSLGCDAEIEVVEDGPLSASIRTTVVLPLPAFSAAEKRSDQLTDNVITSVYTLRKGSPRVDITTIVDNRARDHILRAIFPTHLIGAEKSYAETAHDVVARDIHVPDTRTWREPMTGKQPSISFVDVSDGKIGLAVMHKGLIQYEVLDRPDRAIALTLLRAHQMRNLARIAEYPDQVDSQLPGEDELHYCLMPHAGFWNEADLVAEARKYLLPPLAAQAGKCTGPPKQPLPAEHSFLRVSPLKVKLTALKRSEDGQAAVLRLVNLEDRAIDAQIALDRPVRQLQAVLADESSLAGEGISPVWDQKANTIRLRMPRKKIVTLRFNCE